MTQAVSLDWLTLTGADIEQLASYYREILELSPRRADHQIAGPPSTHVFDTPPGALCLRELTAMPNGGIHTHFAIRVTPDRYGQLHERLSETEPVIERTFGGRRSLYRIDPAGHCVEFGEDPELASAVGPVFEVVLEVSDLDLAVDRYRPLGFDPIDSDDTRPRRRLRGPFDLELWEPHLGIANARGGCHVDLGLTVTDPHAAARHLAPSGKTPTQRDGRLFVRDGDGHTWWLGESA